MDGFERIDGMLREIGAAPGQDLRLDADRTVVVQTAAGLRCTLSLPPDDSELRLAMAVDAPAEPVPMRAASELGATISPRLNLPADLEEAEPAVKLAMVRRACLHGRRGNIADMTITISFNAADLRAPAFAAMWRMMPGFRWLGWLLIIPRLGALAAWACRGFLAGRRLWR